jgi:antitoxin ParD1/3/4
MAMLSITLPKKLKEFAEKQAAAGKYNDVSDYMRDILERDQKRRAAIAEIQVALDEGEASSFVPYVREEFEQRFEELAKAHRLSKKNAA